MSVNNINNIQKKNPNEIGSQVKTENKASNIQLFNFSAPEPFSPGIDLTKVPKTPLAEMKDPQADAKRKEAEADKVAKQTVAKIIINDAKRDKNSAYSPIELSEMIVDVSKKYNMDYKLVASVIKQETHFKQESSGTNGKGLMQLTSITLKDMFQRPDVYDEKVGALIQKYKTPQALMKAVKEDPKVNIEVGVVCLKHKLKSAKGNYKKALVNYNGSPHKVAYSKSVMNNYVSDFKTT